MGVIGGIFFLSKKKKIPPNCLKTCETTNPSTIVLEIAVHAAVTEINVPSEIIVEGILRRRPIHLVFPKIFVYTSNSSAMLGIYHDGLALPSLSAYVVL